MILFYISSQEFNPSQEYCSNFFDLNKGVCVTRGRTLEMRALVFRSRVLPLENDARHAPSARSFANSQKLVRIALQPQERDICPGPPQMSETYTGI